MKQVTVGYEATGLEAATEYRFRTRVIGDGKKYLDRTADGRQTIS